MQQNSYCRKCGAYIPAGETTCVACGHEEKPRVNDGDLFQQIIGYNIKNPYVSNVTRYGVFMPGETVKFVIEITGKVKDNN